MYQRILCPTDGSGFAEQAATHALSIARQVGASLHLLYVIDTSLIDVRALKPSPQEAIAEPSERSMDAISNIADDLGVESHQSVM